MKNFIITVFGFTLIWTAILYNREGVSEIPLFSRNWWICMGLAVSGTMIANLDKDEK